MEFIRSFSLVFVLTFYPIIIGMFILPFFPYLVKYKKFKKIKSFPSLIPFWLTTIILVQVVNWIWSNVFNGILFYEWDILYIQYSLTYYQAPVLDGSSSWIADGLTLWHIYFLFAIITVEIYLVAMFVALFFNRTKKNYQEYKAMLKSSIIWMSTISILSYPFLAILFWIVSRTILKLY